jgi:putative endonuclease
MYYVYLLFDKDADKRYIGVTKDLKQRLDKHNSGTGALFTKSGDFKLVYYEAYLSNKDAYARERKLKQDGRSRKMLYQRVQNCLTG